MAGQPIFRFRDFTLEPHRRTLTRGGDGVDLPERAFAVLVELVRRAPDVVGKDDLVDAAWPGIAVVEDNLVQAVHLIRTALGGDSRNPQFVQTVHRRGYRFIAPVEVVDEEEASNIVEAPGEKARKWSGSRLLVGILLAAVVLVIVVRFSGIMNPEDTPVPARVSSLAVLPFENLSEDVDQEYFADGMTDALITELARLDDLDVISRTSVMRYKETRMTVPQIAAELGVDAVVEGTVTRSGDRVRVIAQLVDSGDRHIWGESYEYPLRDILRLQRDIAEAIAGEIGGHLTPLNAETEAAAAVVVPEAHEAYLKGRYCLGKRTEESMHRAIGFFDQAIELDPDYGPSFEGLADSYNLLANYGFAPSTDARPRARRAAERALELDPALADAHAALAQVEGEFDWNFPSAEVEFQRSLALNPSSAQTHSRYAYFLVSQGRLDEAVAEIRHAHRLDPLSDIISANVGWILMLDGQVAESETHFRRLLDFNSSFGVGRYYLGLLLENTGRSDEAIAALSLACDLTNDSDYARAALAHALATSGKIGESRVIVEQLLADQRERYVSPVSIAVGYLGLGETANAFDALEQAYAERKGWLLHMQVEPVFNGVRNDPRYRALVERIGLP